MQGAGLRLKVGLGVRFTLESRPLLLVEASSNEQVRTGQVEQGVRTGLDEDVIQT